MDILLKPFIAIYHGIQALARIPQKLVHKTEEAVEQFQVNTIKKENTVVDEKVKKKRKRLFSKKEEPKDEIEKVDTPNLEKKQEPIADSGISKRDEHAPEKPLIKYRYVVINAIGKKENGTFEAESENEVRSFLASQDYEVVSVTVRPPYDIDINDHAKMKVADLSFSLTQLSTYIKAGIPLVDAVKILAQQASKPNQRLAYQRLLYDLLKGDNLSDAMDKQENVFPSLLINMVRSAEMTGDLTSILDDMAEYYESMEQVRKEMKSAMTYPAFVIVLAIGVLVFMLIYLVPQFVTLYEGQGASLPAITLFIINSSNFLKNNYIMIIVVILVTILVFWYLYTRIKSFRRVVQTIIMKLPAFGNMIIYKEVYNFTKTFASLINHGVFITDSMEILSKITTNEIYKHIISKTMTNLAKGNTISESFKGEWAFPEIAYQMLVTGESTGQLGLMMEKVSEHYQALHKSAVAQLKSMIEPIMIIVLAGIVGVLLLSIITPMFDIYNQIG